MSKRKIAGIINSQSLSHLLLQKTLLPSNCFVSIVGCHLIWQVTFRGLAFGRESPQELSRLNVSPPDAKPLLVVRFFYLSFNSLSSIIQKTSAFCSICNVGLLPVSFPISTPSEYGVKSKILSMRMFEFFLFPVKIIRLFVK